MNKCITCGLNLYILSQDPESSVVGTPLHHYFEIEFKTAEEFFNKYDLNNCCRNHLMTYIPANKLSELLPNGLNLQN